MKCAIAEKGEMYVHEKSYLLVTEKETNRKEELQSVLYNLFLLCRV